MQLLNALISANSGFRMKVDTRCLKQFEIMPSPFAEKRTDHASSRLLNHQLAFEVCCSQSRSNVGEIEDAQLAFRSHQGRPRLACQTRTSCLLPGKRNCPDLIKASSTQRTMRQTVDSLLPNYYQCENSARNADTPYFRSNVHFT